jgi:hypothetical protein
MLQQPAQERSFLGYLKQEQADSQGTSGVKRAGMIQVQSHRSLAMASLMALSRKNRQCPCVWCMDLVISGCMLHAAYWAAVDDDDEEDDGGARFEILNVKHQRFSICI